MFAAMAAVLMLPARCSDSIRPSLGEGCNLSDSVPKPNQHHPRNATGLKVESR